MTKIKIFSLIRRNSISTKTDTTYSLLIGYTISMIGVLQMPLMNDFSVKLKKLRQSKNYSQQALADKLSVTKSLISSYEQDLRLPSLDMLIKISTEFGVSTDYLLNLDRQKTINVENLTDEQIAIISNTVNEFIKLNEKS